MLAILKIGQWRVSTIKQWEMKSLNLMTTLRITMTIVSKMLEIYNIFNVTKRRRKKKRAGRNGQKENQIQKRKHWWTDVSNFDSCLDSNTLTLEQLWPRLLMYFLNNIFFFIVCNNEVMKKMCDKINLFVNKR